MKTTAWKTAPISRTCEKFRTGVFFAKGGRTKDAMCGAPTRFAYPAMGGGYMALCNEHAQKHLPHITPIEDLIKNGESFA